MPSPPRKLALLALPAALLCWLAPQLHAQELKVQPTPFSVSLDFQATHIKDPSTLSLPIWMESFRASSSPATESAPAKTTFRIRLRRMGQLNSEIQLRLYFDDKPGFAPKVSTWTETGKQLYSAPPLGLGLNLPGSETLNLAVADADYIDIEVPGDGSTMRRAFVTTLKTTEARHALDFEPTLAVTDPFAGPASAAPSADDHYLFGRVKATITAEPFKLTPREQPHSTFEFELDAVPLLAVVSFEVLNVDPVYPPELTVNQQPLGRVSVALPDLADPGYRGTVKPLEKDMRFTYSGWVKCQQVIPASALQHGVNSLRVELNQNSGPIAIRAVELELKHAWKNLDYQTTP